MFFVRLAQFNLLAVRLDSVSGKFKDALAHLHNVNYILHATQPPKPAQPFPDEGEDDLSPPSDRHESSSSAEFAIQSQEMGMQDILQQNSGKLLSATF